MWINRVELHNIKSYGHRTTIELAQGVNAICGQNGAGKTTILEAIGLALFSQSSYKNQDQLINLRAKRGEITITVIDSRDDRAYQVVRPLKGGSPYVYDPETNRQVASGVNDVQQWLRDCMGVEPTTELQALFENAIGVPQGMLTTSFLLTEANRRKVFDPLLGVEDYKRVWDNMLAVVNHVKDQRNENEKEQERRLGRLEELPQLKNDAQNFEDTIKDTDSQYHQATDKLAELSEKLTLMEQQQENIRQLEGQFQTLGERRKGLEAQLKAAETALDEARQAQKKVEQCAADYQAYEQAHQEREDLEEKRKKRDEIQSRLGKCQQALALVQQRLNDLERQLTDAAQAEAKLINLKPLVEKQEALEQEYRNAEKAVSDLRTTKERVSEEEKRLINLQNELADVQGQVRQREEKMQKVQELQKCSDELTVGLVALDQELNDLENQLDEVRQALQAAQDRLHKCENLQKQIETTEQTLEQCQRQLTGTEAELAQRNKLEQALEVINELRQWCKGELTSLEEQINEQESVHQQTQTTLNLWQSKIQTLTNLQGNLETAENRLTEAETELSRLEEELEQRKKLTNQIRSWETEQAAVNEQRDSINSDISRYKTRLSTITEAMAAIEVEAETPCPVCQKPLSEHDITSLKSHYEAEQKNVQADLKDAQAKLRQTNKTLDQLGQQIKQARQEQEQLATEAQLVKQQEVISSYRSEVTNLQQQVAGLSNAPEQVKHFEAQLDEIQKSLADLKEQHTELRGADETDEEEQNRLQAEISQLARQTDVVRLRDDIEQMQAHLTQWWEDVKELSDAPQQVEELKIRDQALGEQKAGQQKQRQQVSDEREDLGKEMNKLQTEMSNLASPNRLAELEAEIEAERKVLAEWQNKVTGLSEAPTQLEAVAKALDELDDPRSKQHAAQVEANKRSQLETEQLKKQAEFEEKQTEKAEIEAELQPFVGLDQALEQVNAILEKTRAMHQTYLEQRTRAETSPQRETQFEEAKQKVDEVVKAQDDLQTRLTQAKESYDPEQHQSVWQEEEKTRTQQTQLETELKGYRQQLAALQKKITGLEAIAAELESLKQEGERLEELQEVVEFIRRTIRDAGPEVTKRLVKAISLKADEIFADIMNDHQQELNWDETYAITVRRDGYERDFQQLSGGETMAAALAVRLALLQSMSAVDVAFFDEPTANLDPERRANLAEQIARVKGFSQLVVISHDDTFEQDIGHVIHIAKNEQGYSQVVA